MKLITAIIRPDRLPDVKTALFRAGVTGMTLTRVSGHGGESEVIQQYRAETVVMEFHEKVQIEMAVSEPFVEPTIQAIIAAARTPVAAIIDLGVPIIDGWLLAESLRWVFGEQIRLIAVTSRDEPGGRERRTDGLPRRAAR